MAKKNAAKAKTPTKVSDPVEAGRHAAITCVKAMEEFRDAATKLDSAGLSDYRPNVSRLYTALRNGWEPICRCWPELTEEMARSIFSHVDVRNYWAAQIARPCLPPAQAWNFAELLFWITVVNTSHHESALEAWRGWVPEYSPIAKDDPRYPEGDADTWMHIQSYLSHFPTDWGKLIDNIKAALPAMPEQELRSAPSSPKPTLPQPKKPLPANRAALERLAKRVDEYVDGLKRGLLKDTAQLYHSLITFRFAAFASDAEVSESKYDADFREVFPYLDELELYVDPMLIAVTLAHDMPHRVESAELAYSTRLATDKRYIRGLDALLVPYRQMQSQIAVRLEELDVRSKEPAPKPRGKRGRKPDPEIRKRDDRLLDAWNTGEYATLAVLGRKLDMKSDAVRKALIRARRRRRK